MEIHHLHEWADGGATDLDNQVSLCPFHHDAIGRGDFTITGDPTRLDGLMVTNRYGLRVRPPTAAELAPPPGGNPPAPPGTATYQPPSGERARWKDIEILPDSAADWNPQLHLVKPPDDVAGAADLPPWTARDADDELVPKLYPPGTSRLGRVSRPSVNAFRPLRFAGRSPGDLAATCLLGGDRPCHLACSCRRACLCARGLSRDPRGVAAP